MAGVYDDRRRAVRQSRCSDGKTARDRFGTAAASACDLLPSGAASWQFVYRLRGAGRSGTQKTVTLGSWPTLDVRKAAEEARRLAGEVAAGRDPRADIRRG